MNTPPALLVSLLSFLSLPPFPALACTTFAVTPGASSDGATVFAAHTNDWGSDPSPGKLTLVPAADHDLPTNRSTSGGSIPQVGHTYQYLTEGYGSTNEYAGGIRGGGGTKQSHGQRLPPTTMTSVSPPGSNPPPYTIAVIKPDGHELAANPPPLLPPSRAHDPQVPGGSGGVDLCG